MNIILDEETFVLYAVKHYDNPQCLTAEEFYDDLKRFSYIKRLLGKYDESGELRHRLILNHLIVLYNLFGIHTTKMLFYKIDEKYYSYLKPFLVLLGYMPDKVKINDIIINSSDITMDQTIINTLRTI